MAMQYIEPHAPLQYPQQWAPHMENFLGYPSVDIVTQAPTEHTPYPDQARPFGYTNIPMNAYQQPSAPQIFSNGWSFDPEAAQPPVTLGRSKSLQDRRPP